MKHESTTPTCNNKFWFHVHVQKMYIGYIHVGGYNVSVIIEDETFSVKLASVKRREIYALIHA